MILSRRGFLSGLGAALAAPAIVKVASLMPIKAPPLVLVNGYADFDTAAAHVRATERFSASLGDFRSTLWPGVKYWFSKEYADTHQYDDLFKELA